MSTFYILPPSVLLGERLAERLRPIFPGLEWDRGGHVALAEALLGAVTSRPEVYVVYREEIPEDEEPSKVLAEVFGAEAGDRIIDVI